MVYRARLVPKCCSFILYFCAYLTRCCCTPPWCLGLGHGPNGQVLSPNAAQLSLDSISAILTIDGLMALHSEATLHS